MPSWPDPSGREQQAVRGVQPDPDRVAFADSHVGVDSREQPFLADADLSLVDLAHELQRVHPAFEGVDARSGAVARDPDELGAYAQGRLAARRQLAPPAMDGAAHGLDDGRIGLVTGDARVAMVGA